MIFVRPNRGFWFLSWLVPLFKERINCQVDTTNPTERIKFSSKMHVGSIQGIELSWGLIKADKNTFTKNCHFIFTFAANVSCWIGPNRAQVANNKMIWVTYTRSGGDSEQLVTFGISRPKGPHLLGTSYYRVAVTFGRYNTWVRRLQKTSM